MSTNTARISLLTLGVDDLGRSVCFYEQLGFVRKARASGEGVAFFDAGGVVLSLFSWSMLAHDAQLPAAPRSGVFRGTTIAWNCASEADVDETINRAIFAGASLLKPAQKVFWGGYSGYFADPDGHAWEVAHNPFFPLDAHGRLALSD